MTIAVLTLNRTNDAMLLHKGADAQASFPLSGKMRTLDLGMQKSGKTEAYVVYQSSERADTHPFGPQKPGNDV